ncbi:MAG: NUDIX domain-containing protein [Syntrophothermus sp.]
MPEEVFLFVSRLTPMVNVDLLIRDEKERVLLAWRDDEFCGRGWHIPGGIVRFKEKLTSRIQKVALSEVGVEVQYNPDPVAINEIVIERKNRGHFISFLYNCFLSGSFVPDNKMLCPEENGYLQWHDSCPENLLKVQDIYRKYLLKKN